MQIAEFLDRLRAHPEYAGQIEHLEIISPRAAEYGELERPLPPALDAALARQGVRRLYCHQAAAVNAVRAGQDVMVATGTASGKTLCYNLPVLEAALADPLARALYLFPTKALAQDQMRALEALAGGADLRGVTYGPYDGDTSEAVRARSRRRTHIVFSNPDMLSMGILPNHPSWAAFFRHLRYVVVDEAHVYRGILGSHVADVLRRLRRVCALYGADPRFVLCSATIANPGEHAARLIGRPVTVVAEDGAPAAVRRFALWNPPMADRASGARRSVNGEASWLLCRMAEAEVRNITFVRARKTAELVLLYAREALRREHPELAERIAAYRGGYLAEERREIERQLFSGELLGVTATNALELGIDVGHLDATVLVGYPGTIAGTRQQAGRAGRSGREALAVLIGQDNPLDQYFMRHPAELFGRSPEHALIDPGNEYVLRDHLLCAAYEAPLTAADAALFGPGYAEAVDDLADEGLLEERDGRTYYRGPDYPAQGVNLRGTAGAPILLMDESRDNALLEEVDAATALFRIHPGAIYLHRGESYRITGLDLAANAAWARPVEVDYYTQPRELNDVQIVRSYEARQLPATDLFFGRVRASQRVIGFQRKQRFSETLLGEEPLDLPPTEFETQALWFEVPVAMAAEVAAAGLDFGGGLHAVEHACIGLLPLFAMCDRNDIGGLSTPRHADTDRPQIFIYDRYPGGVGIARQGFERIVALWRRTLAAVRDCPCEAGCPSCIQSPRCGNNNEPLDKAAAVLILERLLAGTENWEEAGPA